MVSTKILVVTVFSLFFSVLTAWNISNPSVKDDIDTIRQRVLELIIWPKPENISTVIDKALNASETLNSSCYWPDLSYTNGSLAIWDTEYHLFRISNMLRAITVPGTPLTNASLISYMMEQVHCALNVWIVNDWRNPNWWFNEIGVPLEVSMQMLLLGHNATSHEIAALTNITLRAHWWMHSPYYVGTNLLWMIQIEIYRSLATRNTTGLEQGFTRMWQDIKMSNTSADGVQPDWAYHFHNRQLLPGSYGIIWVNNILLFTECSQDTRYQPNEQVLELVANFIAQCDAWVIMTNEFDWSICGRSISTPGITFANPFQTDWLRSLAQLIQLKELKVQLNNLADRLDGKLHTPPLVGNKEYFASDYQVHRRANWIATIKMESHRTTATECILGQNLKGEHLGQGVLNLYRVGYNDYVGIFPLLDWQAINGITVEHDIPLKNCSNRDGDRAGERYVGGVSDGQYGFAAMVSQTHNLTALRSWHFYDEAIIALATNITLNISTTAWTTLASRLLPTGQVTIGFFNSTIVTLNDGNYVFPYGVNKTSNVQWVHIGESNIGYLLQLQQQYHSFGVEVGLKTGDYHEIGPFNETVRARMVTAYINHGVGPYSLDYNYMIVPNVSVESMPSVIKKYEEEQVFACTSSNSLSHGTAWPTLKRATFVSWVNRTTTTFVCKSPTFNLNMTVSLAGYYLFSETDRDFTLTASHPMRTDGYLSVTVDRDAYGKDCQPASNVGEAITTTTNITLTLPTESQLLGAPVNVTCRKRNIYENEK